MKKIAVLLSITFFCFSCGKEDFSVEALGPNSGIVGTWVETGAEEEVVFYNRTGDLDHQTHAFRLRDDGSFIEHTISGWCATPPVAYADYEGTWEAVSDSLLDIVVAYWGGTRTFQMRIVFLEGDELGIRYLFTDERADSK